MSVTRMGNSCRPGKRNNFRSEMVERKPDRINITMGFKRNLGNFQSMLLDAGLESDRLEGETIEQHWERVYGFVERKYLQEFDDLEAEVRAKMKKIEALEEGKKK